MVFLDQKYQSMFSWRVLTVFFLTDYNLVPKVGTLEAGKLRKCTLFRTF